jgi:hypothetical protein
LSGIFRELKACQQVDIARWTADVRFLDALPSVGLAKLGPLRTQYRHRSPLIRNTFFDCFILTRIEVECLSTIDAAPARDIEFWHIVRYYYDELGAQRDHQELDQHVHHSR